MHSRHQSLGSTQGFGKLSVGEHAHYGSYSQNLAIWTLRRLLTPRANMNAPIREAFDCSSLKPMTRHFVSGFPRALLSLSQEKSSGFENGPCCEGYFYVVFMTARSSFTVKPRLWHYVKRRKHKRKYKRFMSSENNNDDASTSTQSRDKGSLVPCFLLQRGAALSGIWNRCFSLYEYHSFRCACVSCRCHTT